MKQELWRLSEAEKSAFTPSSSGLAAEQLGALEQSIAKLASELEQAESGEAAATQPIASPLSRPQLDALLAPQLPLLLTRGYQGSVRQMLTKASTALPRAAQRLSIFPLPGASMPPPRALLTAQLDRCRSRAKASAVLCCCSTST